MIARSMYREMQENIEGCNSWRQLESLLTDQESEGPLIHIQERRLDRSECQLKQIT